MGLDAALADRPGSGFGILSVCGNSMLTYVTYRQTLRPDGRPNPLITGGGTRTLALGHLPISALHDLRQTCFADYICFPELTRPS